MATAWAQAAANADQSFWTCDGPVRDVPQQQAVIASISNVTARGSRYDWDSLRKVHVLQETNGLSAVLELPQPALDLSGRHLLVSVHAGPFVEMDLIVAVEAMRAVTQCSESLAVETPPRDLMKHMSHLIKKENTLMMKLHRWRASAR